MDIKNRYKLIFTKRFLKELRKLYKYTSKSTYSKYGIINLMNKIDDCLMQITIFPKAFSKIINTQYRKAVAKNYIIVYKIHEKKKEVRMVHIFNSRSNYIEKL